MSITSAKPRTTRSWFRWPTSSITRGPSCVTTAIAVTSCGSGSAQHDPEKHLWYYKSLLAVYKQRNTTWLVAELERVLDELEAKIRSAA